MGYMNHLHIKVELMLRHIVNVDQKHRGPKMDPCGTPQEISPKSESLFSMFTRNILSERYDLNHFIVLSENLIALSFCQKIS